MLSISCASSNPSLHVSVCGRSTALAGGSSWRIKTWNRRLNTSTWRRPLKSTRFLPSKRPTNGADHLPSSEMIAGAAPKNATVELMIEPRRRCATRSVSAAADEFDRHACCFPVNSCLFADTPKNHRITGLACLASRRIANGRFVRFRTVEKSAERPASFRNSSNPGRPV